MTRLDVSDGNPRQVMARADTACYAVKAAGRNGIRYVAPVAGAARPV